MNIKIQAMRFIETGLCMLVAAACWTEVASAAQAQARGSRQNETKQDEAKQNETKQDEPEELKFFVNSDTLLWQDFQPADANAEFKTPAKPRLVERMIVPVPDQPPVKLRSYSVPFNEETGLFLFSYFDLPVEPSEELVNDTLLGAMEGSILSVGGRKLSEGKKIRYRNYPGLAYEFRYAHEAKVYQGSSRVFLVGPRQFQVTAIMLEEKYDKGTAEAFLNSLRLIEPQPETAEPTEESKDEAAESKEGVTESKDEASDAKGR